MYPFYGYGSRFSSRGSQRLVDQGIHWALQVKTQPAVEPVSLDQAKGHLHVTLTQDDDMINGKIATARIHAEQFLGKKIMQQDWYVYLDRFPSWKIDFREMGMCPLVSINQITYVDTGGTTQAFNSYLVDTAAARIEPIYGESWPSTRLQMNAVRITLTVGYATKPSDVPQSIKDGMLLRIGTLYEFREEKTFDRGSLAILDSAENCWQSEQNTYSMIG